MIVSHKHKFIFIAIPKTGTHALRRGLRPFLDDNDWEQVGLFQNSVLPIDELAQKGHGHITTNEIKRYLSEDQWESYFKFSIVRNPWDRFISYCYFKMKSRMETFGKNPVAVMKLMIEHDSQFKADILSKPQADFITGLNGKLDVDFVLKQENLQEDFNTLMNQLNLPLGPLEIINSSDRADYKSYYDSELQQIVATYYKRDSLLFGYKF